jgi:probable phosphoglycerate mutase
VLLVRHGQTPTTGAVLPGRAAGLHLGEVGIAQAERAAARIAALGHDTTTPDADATKPTASARSKKVQTPKPRGVTAVYASPLERTQETAKPIAKATKLRVRTHTGLLECDFGDWTGKNLSDLRKLPEWNTVQRYPSGFRFPKGESFAEMQTRMIGAIADLVAKHPGETIVAVSHADTIKAAVAAAMGTHLDLFQRIVVSPCSITAITYTSGGPIVLAVNSTGDDLTALVPS